MNNSRDVRNSRNSGRSGYSAKLLSWALIVVLSVAAIAYIAIKPPPPPPELPEPPNLPSPVTDRSVARAQFFDGQVQPAIAAADRANRQAADRCIERLQDAFNGYRKGIQPLTEDLTSWSTRWGVVSRMPSDWWYEKTDIQDFITKKFEVRLFSNDSLQQSIEDALAKFREDVEANNNKLLTDVKAAVSKADLPQLSDVDYRDFSTGVAESLQAYSAQTATDSMKNLVLTELASGTAGAAAGQIVIAIGARLAATAGTSAAAAGGATVAGGTAGGTGGSTVGPVGTVVGAGVGLVVGVVVDWWMTNSFKAKLSDQLNEMIDAISSAVVDGSEKQMGLRRSLAETCDALRDAYQQSLFNRIVKESNP